MNLYISLKWLEEHIEVVSYEGMWHETETDEFVSVKNIHSAPSIDIVRCKECRHWCCHDDVDYDQTEFVYYCKTNKTTFKGNDFCSRGKRKENA